MKVELKFGWIFRIVNLSKIKLLTIFIFIVFDCCAKEPSQSPPRQGIPMCLAPKPRHCFDKPRRDWRRAAGCAREDLPGQQWGQGCVWQQRHTPSNCMKHTKQTSSLQVWRHTGGRTGRNWWMNEDIRTFRHRVPAFGISLDAIQFSLVHLRSAQRNQIFFGRQKGIPNLFTQ